MAVVCAWCVYVGGGGAGGTAVSFSTSAARSPVRVGLHANWVTVSRAPVIIVVTGSLNWRMSHILIWWSAREYDANELVRFGSTVRLYAPRAFEKLLCVPSRMSKRRSHLDPMLQTGHQRASITGSRRVSKPTTLQ